jgi:hypothetical protein
MENRRSLHFLQLGRQLQQDSVRVIDSAKATISMARQVMVRQHHACLTHNFTGFFRAISEVPPPQPAPSAAEQEQWHVDQEIILGEIFESRMLLSYHQIMLLPDNC